MPLRREFLKLVTALFLAIIGVISISKVRKYFGKKEGLEMEGEVIELARPRRVSETSVEQAIEGRRSRRSYANEPVKSGDISQLCWAAQGITEERHKLRASPSAGALYPLEIFLVIGNSDLEAGIYHYSPSNHSLKRIKEGDYRKALRDASLGQKAVEDGALDMVIAAIYERTTRKYGKRGRERYVHMEAGHVAENIYLQAEAVGLGTVSMGAFDDERVREVLSIPGEYVPLYVMPVGHRG